MQIGNPRTLCYLVELGIGQVGLMMKMEDSVDEEMGVC